jgi:hypothetical protein
MKFLIAAAALVIAAPVAAQTAPAAHAEHEEHKGEKHEGEHKGCCEDGTMACCKPDAAGKRAECCEKHGEKASGEKHGAGHH